MFAATMRSVTSWQAARAASRRSAEQGASSSPPTAAWAPDRNSTPGEESGVTVTCRGSLRSEEPPRTRSVRGALPGSSE